MRPAIRGPQRKKRSGALVGMLFVLAGGGAGGWYYYQNFLQPGGTSTPRDSTAIAAAPADTSAPTDTAVAPPVDSAAAPVPAPPANVEPNVTTGTLVVVGLPSGGRIQIDGKGVDPSYPIIVDPGSHRVTAQATGYDNFSTMVTVARGVEAPLSIAMTRVARPAGGQTGAQKPAGAGSQCENPGATYNLNNACWDDRPVANSAPLVPIGDEIPGNPSPSIVHVLVSPEGAVQRVISKQISNSSDFHLQALAFAKTLTFRPAQKDGQPTRAWVEVMLRPIRNQ
jgi:hypothetical protein